MECKKCKEPYEHEAIGAGRQESVHLLPASWIWLWMAVHFIPANLKYEEHTLSLWESTEDLKGQHPKTLYAGHHNNTKVCAQQEKHGNSHAQKIWIQVNELVINIEEGKRDKLLNKGLIVYLLLKYFQKPISQGKSDLCEHILGKEYSREIKNYAKLVEIKWITAAYESVFF